MTIAECVYQLLEAEKGRGSGAYNAETKCIGLARIGYSNQKIRSGTMVSFLTE
jgi:diphthamide biosynthesis methyltransferase